MLDRTTESGPKPFTDRYLAPLKPASKRYDVLAPSRKGLMLRVTARGTKTFFFRYQKDGRVDRLMIGHYPATPLRQAYEAHAEFTKRIHRGEDPRVMPRSSLRYARAQPNASNLQSRSRNIKSRGSAAGAPQHHQPPEKVKLPK
jgi:hypothetical protein